MNGSEHFIDAYITCAMWSSTDGDENPLDDDGRTARDIDPDAQHKMAVDCIDFMNANETDLALYSEQIDTSRDPAMALAGHDFWLTRNGHGAGFWDRDLGELGERLTRAAEAWGACNLYLDDDGVIYL